MDNKLIGREEEREILDMALSSNKPEMVSIIGRRRIGKTYLIRAHYGPKIDFELTGIQYATRQEQLRNFVIQLTKYSKGSYPITQPKDWLEAFYILSKFLETKQKKEKLILFLDELPWMATQKSGFLKGLSWFWNSWAVDQKIILVICGSAASWMIKNVVHNKGGLHNRITKQIYLQPFTLFETEQFFKINKIKIERYQILLLYMALGGVPHYLNEVQSGKSAAQNIDKLCYSKNGLLRDEFSKLYSSLFDDSDKHLKIIKALAEKHIGLTRSELIQNTNIAEGGGASTILEELEHSGFITTYLPFGKKKKESLYRLTDEFSLFHIRFIENKKNAGKNPWQQISKTQTYTSWSGYAFESICLKHIDQIKKALGISGIYSTTSSYYKKGTARTEGMQIDLLIDRNDQVINLCEIKFYNAELTINKEMAISLLNRLAAFKENSKTKKQIFLTLISTFGIKPNTEYFSVADSSLTMDCLFEKV